MLIIPLFPDLRIGGRPVVTVSIITLCVVMHVMSDEALLERCMYYPGSPNLFQMVSSGLIHADWEHLLGNMIFYLAFGAALEVLIGNALLYLAIMISITVVSAVSYSLYTAVFGSAYPTLGFSDVVFGMIGLSAYMMPRARIRTLFWAFVWVKTFFIPAWILAAWFIGWNLYDLFIYGNESSINIVSHVSGAFTGYFLGRWWLSGRKFAIQDDLDDEIDYMRSARSGTFSGPGSYVNRRGLREMKEAEANARRSRAFDDTLGKVERLNKTHQYADALSMLIQGIGEYGENKDILSYVFETILAWRKSYFTLCYARYHVTYLLAHSAHKEALDICETCFAFAPDFVLENPLDVIPLAKLAERQGRFALAYSLVRNPGERYEDGLDVTTAAIMEARLLAHHLEQRRAAKEIVRRLLEMGDQSRRSDVLAIAATIG